MNTALIARADQGGLGAQTWDNATAGADALVYVIGTNSSTATITYGGATLGANKRLIIDCNGTNQTVNLSGTVTGSGATSLVQYTTEAKSGCIYNHNAAIVTGFGAFNFDALGSTTATTLNITTGTISVTTLNIYDLKVVNVTGAATLTATTINLGEADGDGATIYLTATPASMTWTTLTMNLNSQFQFGTNVDFTSPSNATIALNGGTFRVEGRAIFRHCPFSVNSYGTFQIAKNAQFYSTSRDVALPIALPMSLPIKGYPQFRFQGISD